jgi:protein-S-isoprenylcysteine O-methyltransferase Ste14
MTYGHLLLALGMSAYMLIGIAHEERDLVGHYGDDYVRYRKGVGKLIPRFRRAA